MNTNNLVPTRKDLYLDLVRQGKNDWWRYLLAVFLIFFFWQILGAIPTLALAVWAYMTGVARTLFEAATLTGLNASVRFVVLMLASVAFLGGIWLAMNFIHRRSLRSLVTPTRSYGRAYFLKGFILWFVLSGLASFVEALTHPGRYTWTFQPVQLIVFALLALVFIPIQASTEELFFRGYLLQGFGLWIRNIWVLSTISGFFFMVPHFLNPEASVNLPLMGLGYFLMGAFLAYISLRAGRLELAMGAHTANNLFAVLIANSTITSLPSPSLFTVNTLDPVFSVPASLVCIVLFVWLAFGVFQRRQSNEASPAEASH